MTATTRRRLALCLVVGAIALPVEALLLPVARTPDPLAAADAWTASLDAADLRNAAANIDAYPAHYRKAIMAALDPVDRSNAWRAYLRQYLDTHTALSADQVAVIRDAMEVASPEVLSARLSADARERVTALFARAEELLGRETAMELLVTLGPKKLERASALPLAQQLADRVRAWRVVNASDDLYPCNCNMEFDTCDILPNPWLQCSELWICEMDLTWPMCGPFYAWACTAQCKVLRWPWENN